MNAYIYRADIYCEPCAHKIKESLDSGGNVTNKGDDDSEQYPQGPYHNGGGEADSPQVCGGCRKFLENPLTSDGLDYMLSDWGRPPNNPESDDIWNYYLSELEEYAPDNV